jgi:hypothetical protein
MPRISAVASIGGRVGAADGDEDVAARCAGLTGART